MPHTATHRVHYRKTYEVIGFVPPEAAYALCPTCHDLNVHPARTLYIKGRKVDCACTPIFLDTEGSHTCDTCLTTIE